MMRSKKILTLLTFLLLPSFFGLSSSASYSSLEHHHSHRYDADKEEVSNPSISGSINSCTVGSTWNYASFNLKDGENIASLQLSIHFDTDVVYIGNESNRFYFSTTATYKDWHVSGDSINVTLMFSNPPQSTESLFHFYFDVLDSAPVGTSYFDLQVVQALDSTLHTVDLNGSRIPFTINERKPTLQTASFYVTPSKSVVKKDEEVTFCITSYSLSSIASGSFTFHYDKDIFEYVSYAKGSFLKQQNLLFGINTEIPGSITFSYVATSPIYYSDFISIVLKPKENEDATTKIEFQPESLTGVSGQKISAQNVQVPMTVQYDPNLDATFPVLSRIEVDEEDCSVDVVLSLSEKADIGAGDFYLSFDSDVLDYVQETELEAISYFDYCFVQKDPEQKDTIKINLMHMGGNSVYGDFLSLHFDFVSHCENFETSLDFRGDYLYDTSLHALPDIQETLSFATTTLAHEGQWQVTQEPTCGKDGSKELICQKCGKVLDTERIPASGEHSWSEWTTIKEPTCTDPGEETRRCGTCGEEESRPVGALGHDGGEWVTAREPTCTEPGEKELRCTRCGAVLKTEMIPATGEHSWSEWTTIKEPTCTDPGEETRRCGTCGEEESRPVGALGHDGGEWVTAREPTCTEPGEKELRCTRCGAVLKTERIPATGEHSWSEWTTIKEPTEASEGEEERYCLVCGEKETRSIPKAEENSNDGSNTTIILLSSLAIILVVGGCVVGVVFYRRKQR